MAKKKKKLHQGEHTEQQHFTSLVSQHSKSVTTRFSCSTFSNHCFGLTVTSLRPQVIKSHRRPNDKCLLKTNVPDVIKTRAAKTTFQLNDIQVHLQWHGKDDARPLVPDRSLVGVSAVNVTVDYTTYLAGSGSSMFFCFVFLTPLSVSFKKIKLLLKCNIFQEGRQLQPENFLVGVILIIHRHFSKVAQNQFTPRILGNILMVFIP